MRSFILLRNQHERGLPPEFRTSDVRYPPSLVKYFLGEYTQEGDAVFDPFAGFGTTLHVAEHMNRVGFGVEADRDRCQYARSLLINPASLVCGDARRLASYALPCFDFSLTSPPYMSDHARGGSCTCNPLASATAEGGQYSEYLRDLQSIYAQMSAMMNREAHAVIEVSNLKHEQGVTTLAWDIADAISGVLRFEGEIMVGWQNSYGYGYDHSYCLVFKKPSSKLWYSMTGTHDGTISFWRLT